MIGRRIAAACSGRITSASSGVDTMPMPEKPTFDRPRNTTDGTASSQNSGSVMSIIACGNRGGAGGRIKQEKPAQRHPLSGMTALRAPGSAAPEIYDGAANEL